MKRLIFFMLMLLISSNIFSQSNYPVQNIRGKVIDQYSDTPLSGVSVQLVGFPNQSITNDKGEFVLENIVVGRYDLQVIKEGYETILIDEVMVTSTKEIFLEIQLKEIIYGKELEAVVITAKSNKNNLLNPMALFGGNKLNVEQASRYAGGLDDPARLASSFAGISPGVGNNGISIHGNAPSLLQWRLEDVEIPNPNHFADVATLGGGVLSSLSSNVLGNSDFFIGAFPSEYSNAISGVFDMKLREGNKKKFQHTVQVGLLGLDFASEGPLSRKNNSSYIVNYRYSTIGLLSNINSDEDNQQILDYQDLNFKLSFPTKKIGIFSLWGMALKDKIKPEILSPEKWDYREDSKDSRMNQTSAVLGLNHNYFLSDNSWLRTTIATTYSKTKSWENVYDFTMNSTPNLDFKSKYTNWVFTSSLNNKFSNKHTNKTGITFTNLQYDMGFQMAPLYAKPMEYISEGKGNTNLISAYTSSLFNFNKKISATLGVSSQLLTLNNSWVVEPRVSVKWQSSAKSFLGLAYGLHSRMGKMDVYFVKTKETGNKWVNKDLGFTKTHHIVASYNYKISNKMNLKIEPYFQYLYNVPVVADSSYSVLNRTTFYVEEALVNMGKGRNYGIDITFERSMSQGIYYIFTASLFDSKYKGGDGKWYNTRFNRNYILNGLFGKEWMLGKNKQNVLGINLKLTLEGGDRYSPVDEQATLTHPDKETQYQENKAYSKQLSPIVLLNYSFSYRINREKISHEFSIKGLNATGYKEYFGHEYNLKTGQIEPRRIKNALFNVAYRIDF